MAITEANFKTGMEQVGEAYERLHPGVDVKIQIVPGDGYVTWIRAAIAGGDQTAPDIFNINMTSGYFEAGKAISLKPYLQSVSPYTGKPWIDSFYPEYIEMSRSGTDYPDVPLSFVDIGFFYNKDLFRKAGVEPPTTWGELLDVCEKLQQTDVFPVGIAGDLDNYWQGTVGWLVRVLCDAYYFEEVPDLMARQGDFAYDPETDGRFHMDPADPYCDLLVNIPVERTIQAILDGKIRLDGPRMREIYTRLRDFARYWQPGYNGANFFSARQLFMTQRVAMLLAASPEVLAIEYDMKDLPPDSQFEWGIFRIPSIEDSRFVKIKTRGAGGPLPVYGIVRKTKEQQDRVADFLMYLFRPESCRILVERALEDEQPLIGPFAVKGVSLPEGMEEKYAPFFGLGRQKVEFRGLTDEQESVWRWSTLAQDYMAGRMSLGDFLDQYQRIMVQAIPRVIKLQNLDMNPHTRDNNEGLLEEIRTIMRDLPAESPDALRSREEFVDELAKRLRVLARSSKVSEVISFDLVEEKTIPFKIVVGDKEFEKTNGQARETAEAGGYQYLVVVQLGERPFEYRIHDFRPSYRQVVERLEGKRYTREALNEMLLVY